MKKFYDYDEFHDSLKNNAAHYANDNHEGLINQIAEHSTCLDAFPGVWYILNYATQQYLFVSGNTDAILGHTRKEILETGGNFFVRQMHPDDLQVYKGPLFKRLIGQTTALAVTGTTTMICSFNYRFRKKSGDYIHLKKCFSFLKSDGKGLPIITAGSCNDISAHKTDNKVVFSIRTIDKATEKTDVISETFLSPSITISDREQEVVESIALGLSSKQIADKLNISLFTVNAHRQNILKKTQTRNVAELMAFAVANGIVTSGSPRKTD